MPRCMPTSRRLRKTWAGGAVEAERISLRRLVKGLPQSSRRSNSSRQRWQCRSPSCLGPATITAEAPEAADAAAVWQSYFQRSADLVGAAFYGMGKGSGGGLGNGNGNGFGDGSGGGMGGGVYRIGGGVSAPMC